MHDCVSAHPLVTVTLIPPMPLVCAVLVARRNWQATAARVIIAPFIFMALIWVVNEALTTGNDAFNASRSIPNPTCAVRAFRAAAGPVQHP